MSLIERIRKKPQEEKIRIIWTVMIIAAVTLVAIWVITARYSRTFSRDTTLFDTIDKGVNDFKNNYKK